MPTTLDRDRLLTIMCHKNHGMAQIRHMIALLSASRWPNRIADPPGPSWYGERASSAFMQMNSKAWRCARTSQNKRSSALVGRRQMAVTG